MYGMHNIKKLSLGLQRHLRQAVVKMTVTTTITLDDVLYRKAISIMEICRLLLGFEATVEVELQ
jgi:hypothetical protein